MFFAHANCPIPSQLKLVPAPTEETANGKPYSWRGNQIVGTDERGQEWSQLNSLDPESSPPKFIMGWRNIMENQEFIGASANTELYLNLKDTNNYIGVSDVKCYYRIHIKDDSETVAVPLSPRASRQYEIIKNIKLDKNIKNSSLGENWKKISERENKADFHGLAPKYYCNDTGNPFRAGSARPVTDCPFSEVGRK
ncbi:MAG: hypothetical protein K0R14_1743 [Burkholderiales bacterium]|nr:hypothetical protein [Burkholderiales bacterium]